MTPVPIERLLEHRAWVRAIARGLVADESRVDDLEQETWLRALRRPPRGTGIRAWLRRVVRRLAIDEHRRDGARGRRETTAAGGAEPPSPPELLQQAELQRAVADLVVRLDEPYRAVVLLRYFEGLTPRAIAARLGVPVETVRTRLKRALGKMRHGLDADHADWCVGMLALAGFSTLSVNAATGGVIVGTTSKKLVAVAIVLALLLGGALWHYAGDDAGAETPRASNVGHVAAPATDATSADEAGPPGPDQPAAAGARWVVRGRVVTGSDGIPVPGVVVRAEMFRGYTTDGPPVRTGECLTGEDGRTQWSIPDPEGTVTLRFKCAPKGMIESRASLLVVRGEKPRSFTIHTYALDRVVFGRVTDVEGVPVADALVWAGGRKQDAVKTDRHGVFRVRAYGNNTYLYVLADGYAAHRAVPKLGGPGSETEVDVKLRHEFRIAGTIRDEEGRPVSGAVVATFFTSRHRTTTTDADGKYVLGHLDPGRTNHSLYARKKGYREANANIRTEGAVVQHDLVLRRGVRIEGRVVGPDGKPVAGARLNIGFSPHAANRLDAISRDDGSFVFPVVPGGAQILRTRKAGLAPDRRELQVPEGLGTQNVEVVLSRAHHVSGIIRGADGKPAAGVYVSARANGEYLRSRAVSDDEGRFRLKDLPATPVELELFATGYIRQNHKDVAVDREDLEYIVQRAASLAGRIVDGATGLPIDTFTIRFKSASHEGKHVGYSATWAREGHRFSGSDGYWTCDNQEFPPGTVVTVEAHAEGYAPTRDVGVTAAVDPSRDASIIELHPGVALTGVLVDPAGRPVEGATVKLTPGAAGTWRETHDLVVTKSGADGRFRFDNVAPGQYSLHADHARFAPAYETGVRVVRGEVVPQPRIAFTLPGRIHGVAKPGVKVHLNGHGGRVMRMAEADAKGRFAFENLGTGKYNVAWMIPMTARFSVTGFARTVDLEAPAMVEVSLVPTGTARVSGRVDGALAGGVVSLTPIGGGPPSRGVLAKDGAFVFEGVEPGRYYVSYANHTARAFAHTEITIADGERQEVALKVPKKKG